MRRVVPHRLLILFFTLFLSVCYPFGCAAASSVSSKASVFLKSGRFFAPGLILVCACSAAFCIFLWQTFLWHRSSGQIRQENEAMLKALTDNLHGGVVALMQNKDASLTYANEGFWSLLGLHVPAAAPAPPAFLRLVSPEDRSGFLSTLYSVRKPGQHIVAELDLLCADETPLPVLLRGTLSVFNGKPLLFCVIVDVREQKELQRHLVAEHERYEVLIAQSDAIIFDANLENGAVVCSSQFEEVFGRIAHPVSAFTDARQASQLHPEDRERLFRLQRELSCERPSVCTRVRLQKASGEYLWCDLSLHGLCSNGKLTRLIGKIVVVDEQVKEHMRLEMLSRIDQMTGVYHKEAFQFLAQNALAEQSGEGSVLFFIDLDNFKQLNDHLGHLPGDEALRHTARMISSIFRENDLVGRFGGDEFYVFAQHMPLRVVRQKAVALCQRLQQEFPLPEGGTLCITASVGIARSPNDGLSFRELLSKADQALYAAKALGKSKYRIYREDLAGRANSAFPKHSSL